MAPSNFRLLQPRGRTVKTLPDLFADSPGWPHYTGECNSSAIEGRQCTPTIASWWVGLVTPIPSGLARPLVESLECDAVMADHDIDDVIAPPEGGLTGYRDAVAEALKDDGTASTGGRRHLLRFSSAAPQ